MVWEMLIAGVVVFAFLAAVALWVHSALRKVRRLQLRRNAFVSSRAEPAQPQRGDDGCAEPDRVLQRPLSRDLWPGSVGYFRKHDRTGNCWRCGASAAFSTSASRTSMHAPAHRKASLPNCPAGGRFWSSILRWRTAVRWRRTRITASSASFRGSWHRPSSSWNQYSTTCRYAWPPKSIEDGRYIFANKAFERFSRFSRDIMVGSRADAIFKTATAARIEAADQAALDSPDGQFRNEFVVERGSEKRVLASNRVIARNEKNEPEFLIALFDDITDRRSLSRELENTKKFLELVV